MRLFLASFISFFALLFASCKMEETITIKADGSATLVQEISVNQEEWQEMKDDMEGEGMEEAKEQFSSVAEAMGEGVEFVEMKTVDRLGGKGALIVEYSIADINQFTQYEMQELMRVLGMGEDEEEDLGGIKFQLEQKKLTVTRPKKKDDQQDMMM